MKKSDTIYRRNTGKEEILQHHKRLLEDLGTPYNEKEVATTYGAANCIIFGNKSKQPVFFFPGSKSLTPQSLALLRPLLSELHIIAVDLPGHAGKSSEKVLSVDDDSYMIWYRDILQGFGLESADTIGYSFGGAVILSIAKANPALVKSAVLMMPAGLISRGTLGLLFSLYLPAFLFRLIPIQPFLNFLLLPLFEGKIDPQWRETIGLVLKNVRVSMRMPQPVHWQDIEIFKNPVLLIVGEKDYLFPGVPAKNEGKFLFPNLHRTLLLENIGHIPSPEQDISEIYPIIEEFVEKSGS